MFISYAVICVSLSITCTCHAHATTPLFILSWWKWKYFLCIYNQLNIVALLIYIHVWDNWLLEQDDTQWYSWCDNWEKPRDISDTSDNNWVISNNWLYTFYLIKRTNFHIIYWGVFSRYLLCHSVFLIFQSTFFNHNSYSIQFISTYIPNIFTWLNTGCIMTSYFLFMFLNN